MLDENTNLTSFEKNNLETKEDRYFSFIEKKKLKIYLVVNTYLSYSINI